MPSWACSLQHRASPPRIIRPAPTALPLAAAQDAAGAAVARCAVAGSPVTAVVLDPAGQFQVVLRGDGTTFYAMESARLKAYTILNLGPIRKVSSTDALAKQVLPDPSSGQMVHIPEILLKPGGVAIMRPDGALAAAIGVAGSPAGARDEDCAPAGAAVARTRLENAKP